MRREVLLLACLLTSPALADDAVTDIRGYTKFNLNAQSFPDDSAFGGLVSSNALDLTGELRLMFESRKDRWKFDAHYQLVGIHGDSLELANQLPLGGELLFRGLPSDDRRWFDLTGVIDEGSDSALFHRADRLSVAYTSERLVVRFGRQALSWGNGMLYAPMDLVNPFDPAAIDTEYKTGDDMLYTQYLRGNGHDVQAAFVVRRELLSGDVESEEGTAAVKYHGFAGDNEYDVLLAQSYDDTVFGLGTSRPLGGAIWSGDLVVTDTDIDTRVELVSNLSYSWVAWKRNMTGILEYYFNGFGQHDANYDPISLVDNPELLARLARGRTFALGRHYLAGSVTVEVTPLWTVTPVLLSNLNDPSALLQLTTNYSLGDNLQFLGSINLPLGGSGTEFGGINTGLPGLYFSVDAGLFAQIAWYF